MLLNTKTDVKRSGMILLIVVAFLSMFLVVGTTYLLVADSIRRTSDFDLNATDKRSDYALMPDIDPRYMLNFALGQILYDVVDPTFDATTGKILTTNSSLRGHSLARDIYGGYNALGGNDRPFQGMGKDTATELNGSPNYMVVGPTNGVGVRDPEKGTRTTANPNLTKISSWNPPYTFANNHHLYLGSYKLDTSGNATGNPSFTGLDAVGLGLDVKNLEGYPGGNDSYWIDAGFPVMTTPDGRKYKALIAPLILDLDGRINLNVAGNLMQRDAANPNFTADHASNQGWGRWEINPKKLIESYAVLNPPGSPPGSPNNPLNISQTPFPSSDPLVPENEFLRLLSFTVPSTEPGTTGVTNPPTVPKPPNSSKSAALNSSIAVDNQWRTFGRYTQAKYLPINSSTTAIDNNNPPQTSNFNFVIPHSYGQVDFNGAGEPGTWGGTAKPTFVNANGFPTFGQGFGNGYAYEFDPITKLPTVNMMTNKPNVLLPNEHFLDPLNALATNYHARNYNPYRTQSSASGVSTVFPVSETASILRWQGKGEPFSKSQLAQLLPKSLGLDMPYESATSTSVNKNDAIFRQRIRNMVTTLSADLDRPAMVPIDLDPNYKVVGNNSPNDYPLRSVDTVISTPNITTPSLKLDLNRALRSFPPYTSTSGLFYDKSAPSWTNTESAIKFANEDREAFAGAIFNYLKNITGFSDSDNSILIIQQTNRWLAQLAVNIVDFIDNDDFNTRWQWTPGQWVFGVEMPRLVINELYVQCQNNKNDMLANDTATDPYDINTFIELYNPLVADATYGTNPGTHKAVLQYAIDPTDPTNVASNYKLVIAKRGKTTDLAMFSDNIAAKITEIDTNSVPNKVNYHGAFDFTSPMATPPTLPLSIAEVTTWQDGDQIVDVDTCKLLRDSADLRTLATPAFNGAFNFKNASLNMTVPLANTPGLNDSPAVFLQRLVMPGLPFENDQTKLLYNPYITTDSFAAKNMHDYRERDKLQQKGAMIADPLLKVKSASRLSPFLDSIGNSFYNGANAQPSDPPTFNFKNNNGNKPWFTFLDRQLINPLELIHVPCCKPHELTQMATRWGDLAGQSYPFAANWPWFDENTRLYRFLEAVGVSPLQAGEAMHGRALGKVNVNTMHSEEVFQAVADAAPANNFTAGDLNTVGDVKTGYGKLVSQLPILSFGQANYTAGMVKYGLNRSLMGYTVGNKPNENILDVASFNADGPNVATYARKELLTKIGNSVTTKSNVFAVWITTGYFEVTNDTTQPPTLGLEIGKLDGINIRHRMFAIVDRTNMVTANAKVYNAIAPSPLPQQFLVYPVCKKNTGGRPGTASNPTPYNPNNDNYLDFYNGNLTTLRDGLILTFDPNTDNEETVVLIDSSGTGVGPFQAVFRKAHSQDSSVINRGNPGPWVGYDRTKDRDVVPYAEIIE